MRFRWACPGFDASPRIPLRFSFRASSASDRPALSEGNKNDASISVSAADTLERGKKASRGCFAYLRACTATARSASASSFPYLACDADSPMGSRPVFEAPFLEDEPLRRSSAPII